MNKKNIITLGVVLVFIGLFLVFSNYFSMKKAKVYDTITLAMSELPSYVESTQSEEIDTENPNLDLEQESNEDLEHEDNNDENPNKNTETPSEYYIGKLEIPKINFSRGFTSLNSKYNNVNKNIAVIKKSTYPDVDLGNFILAGHTGTNWNSFFNDLYKLKLNDTAYVYYKNVKYKYKLVNIYEEPKTGTVRIFKDYTKTTLTLVTCTKGTKDKQSVYIFNLIDKE